MYLISPEPGNMEGGDLPPTVTDQGQSRDRVVVFVPRFPLIPCSRSTIFVRLHTNGNQELQYQPGDHLGVFPGNHEDLVNALIERLEDAPPANHMVKVEMLEERNTALGEGPGCTCRKGWEGLGPKWAEQRPGHGRPLSGGSLPHSS